MAPGSIVLVGTSPWVYALVAIDAAIVLLIAGGVVWIILRGRKKA